MLLELYYVKQRSILVVASVKNQQTRPGLRRDCAGLKLDHFPGCTTLTGEQRHGSGRYTAGRWSRASVRAKPSTDLQVTSPAGPVSSRPACPWLDGHRRTVLNRRRARPVPAGPILHQG